MNQRDNRRFSLSLLISGAVALIGAIFVINRLRPRRKPKQAEITPTLDAAVPAPETPTGEAVPETETAAWGVPARSRRMLLRAAGGFGCFVLAQIAMLIYKTPTGTLPEGANALYTTIAPLLLYPLGLWLVFPALLWAAKHEFGHGSSTSLPDVRRTARNPILITLLLLMVFALLMIQQTPTPATPLPDQQAFLQAAANGQLYTDDERGTAYALLITVFTGGSAENGWRWMQFFSAAFALLTIPAVYLLAREISGEGMSIIAAGLTATALWTLGIAKSGGIYTLLALIGALAVWLLLRAYRSSRRSGYLAVAAALGIGTWFTPLAAYAALLLPAALLLQLLDARLHDKKPPQRAINALLLSLAVFALFTIPALLLRGGTTTPRPRFEVGMPYIFQPPYQERVGYSEPYAILDGAFHTLLMLNLTSDPTPFYGAANRPVVAPVVSAAFALGCLALIWRVAVQKRGEELLILAALGICILPSALLIESPIRYPNMGRAALALPVMMLIAAWGLNLIAEIALGAVGNGEPANPPNNQNELAQIRLLLAGLFVVVLALSYSDAVDHYGSVALPAYERAAEAYNELFVNDGQ